MLNRLTSIVFILLLHSGVATSHEYWLQAAPTKDSPSRVDLSLNFGEYFIGELTPFSSKRLTRFERYHLQSREDLRSRIPRGFELSRLPIAVEEGGTHLVALDTTPNFLTLPADKFFDYLHDEGLDAINRLRAQNGLVAAPGRERYRRNVKTLARSGGILDDTFKIVTGQRLELVPQSDPLAIKPGEKLALMLIFDGQPLPGALLKAFHRDVEQATAHSSGQLTVIRAISDDDGVFHIALPWPGQWMLSVVHMIAATDSPDVDWDSYWSNLTFELLK